MNDINIGAKIAARRREKGVTQEELAGFLGVSKAAVSKWESGQSYPDITLLPVLATYFNMTVDCLLGYEPQMTKEDVRRLYLQMCRKFAEGPFDDVYAQCHEYAKKYYSCWDVQLHIGTLLINHSPLAGEKMLSIIEEAAHLFERVAKESDDSSIAQQALYLQSYCYLALNQPVNTIDLLDGIDEPMMSRLPLLAKAYQMKGDLPKARGLLQGYIYGNLASILGVLPDFMGLYLDDPARTDDGFGKFTAVGKIFELEAMHPALYFTAYLATAQVCAMQGREEEALDMLEKYIHLLGTPGVFPLKLHGNAFFDSLDDYLGGLDLGIYPPRSNEVIKQSAKDGVLASPIFESLKQNPRFVRLVERLNNI
jgi:transcriptional regulator with XRE-family HTH domain